MTTELLTRLIFAAGVVELCISVASALVPLRLNWRREFRTLSPLHRQLYWVYGGYTLSSIVAIGAIALFNATELARGGMLAQFLPVWFRVLGHSSCPSGGARRPPAFDPSVAVLGLSRPDPGVRLLDAGFRLGRVQTGRLSSAIRALRIAADAIGFFDCAGRSS